MISRSCSSYSRRVRTRIRTGGCSRLHQKQQFRDTCEPRDRMPKLSLRFCFVSWKQIIPNCFILFRSTWSPLKIHAAQTSSFTATQPIPQEPYSCLLKFPTCWFACARRITNGQDSQLFWCDHAPPRSCHVLRRPRPSARISRLHLISGRVVFLPKLFFPLSTFYPGCRLMTNHSVR